VRIGVGGYGGGYGVDYLFVPVHLNTLIGERRRYIEIGAGLTFNGSEEDWDFIASVESDDPIIGTLILGYRYQNEGGYIFRAGFSPYFGPDIGFMPFYGYVSFGLGF
jgi:hypothetical protein